MCSPKNSCNKGVAMVKPPSLIVRESGILNLTLPMNLIADKHRTSTIQVQDKLIIENENIKCVIEAVGNQPLSMKSIMQALGLKSRDHFLKRYLRPAIDGGYLRLLYPDAPRSPRQKYLLTQKGLLAYKSLGEKG